MKTWRMGGGRGLIGFLMAGAILLGLAALPAHAVGTSADTGAISNGYFFAGDTVPRTYGRVSVAYFKTPTNSDSRYQGPAAADTITVDTAYDLRQLYNLTVKSGGVGETVTFVYWIENLGNATYRIDFDTIFIAVGALKDTNWGAKYYTIFYDRGAGGGDSDIAGDSRNLLNTTLPPGAFRQVIVTVAIPDTAISGDSTHIMLQVTDNAPLIGSSTTGDLWETGAPLPAGQTIDYKDTMWDTVVVLVKGPNVVVSKTCTEVTAGRSRPGDTLTCNITFDNDGDSEARGVYIYDAIPQFTRYQKRSADTGIFAGNSNQTGLIRDTDIVVAFDTDPLSAADDGKIDFKDTETNQADTLTAGLVTIIRWSLKSNLAADDGDALNAVNFNDNGATLDNGRVEFRVVIE